MHDNSSSRHKAELNEAYLLLGSNLGNRRLYIATARYLLNKKAGKVMGHSDIYSSEPWGMNSDREFLNQALLLRTNLKPGQLIECILDIELEMGRKRTGHVDDRTIDIDIILYDNQVVNTDSLTIPHPRVHLRRFALVPLAELAPTALHPVFQKTFRELLEETVDQAEVSILDT